MGRSVAVLIVASLLLDAMSLALNAASGTFSFRQATFRASGSGEERAEISVKREGGTSGAIDLVVLLGDGSHQVKARVPVTVGDGEAFKLLDLSEVVHGHPELSLLAEIQLKLNLSGNAPFDAFLGEPNTATLVSLYAPNIISPLKAKLVDLGNTTTLSVAATGAPKPTFQWRKNGNLLTGETQPSLTLTNLQPIDTGLYSVVVANAAGLVSSEARMTVNTSVPPRIVRQPQSQSLLVGERATLEVELLGSSPFRFQWEKNGFPIPGATNRLFEVSRVQLADTGTYAARVLNPFGMALTETAALVVDEAPPIVTAQPRSQTIRAGGQAHFEVAVRGSEPLSYQWSKDGRELPAPRGSVLLLENAQLADAGTYSLTVSNSLGRATSTPAILTVLPPAPLITIQPLTQFALVGTDLMLFVHASSPLPLTYQWRKEGRAIPGATNALFALTRIKPSQAGGYSVTVSDSAGEVTVSRTANLIILEPPEILTASGSSSGQPGTNITLSVQAKGTPPLQFQWAKDGDPLPGQTNAQLVFPNLRHSDEGKYQVTIRNAYGTATSAEIPLTVVPASSPKADFNGDDFVDIIFQDRNGFLAAWLMKDFTMTGTRFLIPDQAINWRGVGSGDFNRDGAEDIVLQHSDGTLVAWLMGGLERKEALFLNPSHPGDKSWQVVGVGDFNADEMADLLFQDSNGTIAVWLMNGTHLLSAALTNPSRPAEAGWRVGGIGDFNGDNVPDLALQQANGSLMGWALDRLTRKETLLFVPSHPGENWRLAGVADINRDGESDLLFQNDVDGSLAVWLMRGTLLQSARLLDPSRPGGSWQMIAPK